MAVNLTRPLESALLPPSVRRQCDALPALQDFELVHHIGGPCFAHGLALYPLPPLASGAAAGPLPAGVRRIGNQGGCWIGGEIAAVCQAAAAQPGWKASGSSGAEKPRLQLYWGDARWSRTQLLGELARGNWGMCRAAWHDVFGAPGSPPPPLLADPFAAGPAGGASCWAALQAADPPRLVFAAASEMTAGFSSGSDSGDDDGGGGGGGGEQEEAAAAEAAAVEEAGLAVQREELRARVLAQTAAEAARQAALAAEAVGGRGGKRGAGSQDGKPEDGKPEGEREEGGGGGAVAKRRREGAP